MVFIDLEYKKPKKKKKTKKKRDYYLVLLVLLKWLAEFVYFVGIVFVAGTALLLLTHNILGIPLNYIHIVSLVGSFAYMLIGFLVTNSFENITIASNYFKILSALGYLSVISYFDNRLFVFLKDPVIDLYLAAPFLLAVIYKRYYRKLVYRAVFKKQQSVSFYSQYSNTDEIKDSMMKAVRDTVKEKHQRNVEVVGKNFRQDAKGNVVGIFKIVLARKLLGASKPKLMLITLRFNLNNNE